MHRGHTDAQTLKQLQYKNKAYFLSYTYMFFFFKKQDLLESKRERVRESTEGEGEGEADFLQGPEIMT